MMDNLPGSLRDRRVALAVFGAQAALIYGVLLVPQDVLKTHTHYVYLAHYLLFLPFLFNARDRCAFFFSPSFLIVSYVCFSFTIGGFAFAHRYVLSARDLVDFGRWEHHNFATCYFMTCNVCAVFAYFLARRRRPTDSPRPVFASLRAYGPQLIMGVVLLTVFSVVSVGLAFFGGAGNFSLIPRMFGFLVIAVVLAKTRWRYRFVVYVGLLLLFAAAEYGNRRIIIVLGLSVVFMEAAHLQDLRLSFRRVLICALVLSLVVILQVTMTITRGLNGFKGSYWQSFTQIERFLGVNDAITYSLKQTEGPSTFFHSNNGMNYVLEDPSLLSYGSTLAKALFIAVPRSVLPNKPRSMVDIYTMRWFPAWRKMGCSTGINVYAEYFWNFHVLGVLCVVLIFYLLNRVFFFYLSMLRAGAMWPFVYLGVAYNYLLMYARGHGLDGFAIPVVFALLVQWTLFNPFLSSSRFRRQRNVHPRDGESSIIYGAAPAYE
jgi:hypothetical protein